MDAIVMPVQHRSIHEGHSEATWAATEPQSMKDTARAELLPLTPLSHAILLALADEKLHGYTIVRDVDRARPGERCGPAQGRCMRHSGGCGVTV